MKRNIIVFYVLAFLQGLVFYSSVSTLYRTSAGITLTEMGIIEGVLSVCTVLCEVPWGILTDHIGYRKTLIIANGLYALSKIIFYHADCFGMFLMERIVLGISLAGLSGCDSALLYLSTGKDKATGIFGKMSMSGTLGMCVASVSFSLLFKDSLKASAFWTAVAYCATFILTFFLTDVKEEHGKENNKNYKGIVKVLPGILPLLVSSALLTESTHMLSCFYNQLQYERAGIPVSLFGVLYLLIQMCGLISGGLEKMLKKVKQENLVTFLTILAMTVCFLLVKTTSACISVMSFALLVCIESLYFPVLNTLENDCTGNFPRATALSVFSLVSNGCTFFTEIAFGMAADESLNTLYVLVGVFCFISFLLFQNWKKRHHKIGL